MLIILFTPLFVFVLLALDSVLKGITLPVLVHDEVCRGVSVVLLTHKNIKIVG